MRRIREFHWSKTIDESVASELTPSKPESKQYFLLASTEQHLLTKETKICLFLESKLIMLLSKHKDIFFTPFDFFKQ